MLVVEPTTFPTDGYITAGVADLMGLELRWCDPADPLAAVDDDVALLSLTHVDFRTGAMFDMATITAEAQARGALVQWDLCHSTGAVPGRPDRRRARTWRWAAPTSTSTAVPAPRPSSGSRPEHQAAARQPITGWMGHAEPFAMARDYVAVEGIGSFASGTPPVLALSALEAALEVFDEVSVPELQDAGRSS